MKKHVTIRFNKKTADCISALLRGKSPAAVAKQFSVSLRTIAVYANFIGESDSSKVVSAQK